MRARLLYAFLLGPLAACAEVASPSLIVISMDTVRADHLSVYGYERETTPYLDALAQESLVYERAYTTAPWTQPSHMSLFTGLWPMQHRVIGMRSVLARGERTLAQHLEAAGYFTAALYKPGWIHERHGFDRGFRRFEPHEDAAELERQLLVLEERLSPDEPFFLFVHLFDAHNQNFDVPGNLPYDAPDPFGTHFLPDARRRLRGIDPRQMWTGNRPTSEAELEAVVALYDGAIRYVDSVVGRAIERWGERGLLDNTMLLVTSDHGEPLGQREGKLNGHGKQWEEGLRIPMLLRLPGAARAGERVPHAVSLVDVLPTALEVLGLPGDDELPGRSLLGPPSSEPRLLAQHPQWSIAGFEQYKLYSPRGEFMAGREHIFDLEADPHELAPLERETELWRALAERMGPHYDVDGALFETRGRPRQDGEMSAEDAAELDALGYGGDDL